MGAASIGAEFGRRGGWSGGVGFPGGCFWLDGGD